MFFKCYKYRQVILYLLILLHYFIDFIAFFKMKLIHLVYEKIMTNLTKLSQILTIYLKNKKTGLFIMLRKPLSETKPKECSGISVEGKN